MFANKDTLISQLRSPMNVASMALDEIEARMGGDQIIADPNSPFCHLLEMSSSLVAASAQAIDEKLPVLYPKRAQTMEDLYHHMSDFDYLRMYSTPSQTNMQMILPKQYLLMYAKDYNENYKKITIPKDTVFRVGRYPFGIYYPIDILINNYTKTFTTVYDTSKHNPLMTLTKNVVDKLDMTYGGLDYLLVEFPIYQFAKSTQEESMVAETGFTTKIVYNDKFHAVRLYSYSAGVYTELNQSQSKVVYDTHVPTALVRVLPDEQRLVITIPQIYFDKGLMGSKLLIEVYTTMGALDINTINIPQTSLQANFALKSKDTTEFSAIFKNLPFDLIMRLASDKITGGSDAIDVDTLRNRVVNDLLYEKVAITESEMEVYLNDNGFNLKLYRDNVTDRVYHAYRILEDGNGSVIPSVTLPMRMLPSYANEISTYKLQNDDTITILPTTIFRYVEAANDVVPLTNDEMQDMLKLSKEELADFLNNGAYFKTPFHMHVDLSDLYPTATSFDLMCPSVKNVIFEAENYDVADKMVAFDAAVTHLDSGIGGYRVDLSVSKSDSIKNLDESYFKIYVLVNTRDGYTVGTEAVLTETQEARWIYSFYIRTNYHLFLTEHIGVTNFENADIPLNEHILPLEADYHVVYMVDKSQIQGTYQDAPYAVSQNVPSDLLDTYVALARQYVTVHLGHSLADVIKNDLEVSSSPRIYETWNHDVPKTYSEDVYETDENGSLKTETDTEGNVNLMKLATAGDVALDNNGDVIYTHKEGDVYYDPAGEPRLVTDRNRTYYIDTMLIDAKVFASERVAETEFVSGLYPLLESYFDIIRNLQTQALERTAIYFRCVRSTGSAQFNLGDGVIVTKSTEMAFRIICYVPSYVKKDDQIQDTIVDRLCDALERAIKTKDFSMMDVFYAVKIKMADYIDHMTLLGTWDDVTSQTFRVVDEDAQPSLARRLELTEDNILSLKKQLDVTFVALEDNTSSTETYSV